jgi:hypothetical protein
MAAFADASNTAVLSCGHVIYHAKPILYVAHDADDGGWQFLCGASSHNGSDICQLALHEILEMDDTLLDISDLPTGFVAERKKKGSDWIKRFET